MLSLAITGGIATGKSTAVQMMRQCLPDLVVFDCDADVKRLIAEEKVISEIHANFGDQVINAESRSINRKSLREIIFNNSAKKQILESILHPLLRKECLALKEKAAIQGARCFLADVPLLFENEFNFGYEKSITVATSHATQVARLKARSDWDDDTITSVLRAQLPISEKISRADIVFWNEGTLTALQSQVARFCEEISTI